MAKHLPISECQVHPGTKLVCMKCMAAKGGRSRARRHSKNKIRTWGKQGGRPKS